MVILSAVFSIVLLSLRTTINEDNPSQIDDQNPAEECRYCDVSFRFSKVNRHHSEKPLERITLTADEFIKRNRKGRFMLFSDYDEVYFNKLTIDQPLNARIVKLDMADLISLIYSEESFNVGNTLSRVLIEKVRIHFKPPKKQPIVLTADNSSLLTDTMTMRFDGNVTIVAKKCKISTNVAIWSNEYSGLYFLEPYRINNKIHKTPAFFQITNTGRCKRAFPAQAIEYIDKLDVFEGKMFESLPMDARQLFGLPAVVALPAPKVTLIATPTVVTYGGSSHLVWSSTNATSCHGLPGTVPLSGILTITPTASTAYTLKCTGPGGTVSASVKVSTITKSVACLFDWAEKKYAYLFKPTSDSSPMQVWKVYTYRHYPSTGIYLGVSSVNSHVYFKGQDGRLQDKGALSHWLQIAGCK